MFQNKAAIFCHTKARRQVCDQLSILVKFGMLNNDDYYVHKCVDKPAIPHHLFYKAI